MLFNSYAFMFAFVPLVLVGFFQIARISRIGAAAWLALASLFFYGYWNPAYVGLLLASIAGNYLFGLWLARLTPVEGPPQGKPVLALAVTLNLLLLGYFKYANFFVDNVNRVADAHFSLADIVLPLGISFFTFTQIAYLVDTYQGKVKERNIVHYLLFVTYFPHLIAGPVLHHKQMMPQFRREETYRWNAQNFQIGLAFFSMGLAKKVLLADSLATYASPVFGAAHAGVEITLLPAWIGVLAYAFQIYFDFSGYSDMAVGVSKLIGIDLPFNFNSPYKAPNIIEFWRRWHMTLSQFLRDYLYIPLGGNRHGSFRRHLNLLATMTLGGLWHGANWTFVIWGLIHGAYLVINHFWRHLMGVADGASAAAPGRVRLVLSTAVTFVAVLVAWVFFRSDSVSGAMNVLRGMCGLNGISLPRALIGLQDFTRLLPMDVSFSGVAPGVNLPESLPALLFWFVLASAVVWLLPNTQQLISADAPRRPWERALVSGSFCGLLFCASVLSLSRISEFLYFQF